MIEATAEAEKVLYEIEQLASQTRRGFLPIIGPVKGRYLAEAVTESGAKSILEVGTLVGYSAILMATRLPADGHIDTLEINRQSAHQAEENIRRAGMQSRISVHVGNALDLIPQTEGTFDLLFIDAEKSEYRAYLRLAEPKVKKQGVVFADNVKVFAGQMKNYLEYVRKSGNYASRYIDVGFDGVEISTKLI